MRRTARNGLVLLVGQVLGRGAQAAYTIVMVRELSLRGYGDLAYVIAVAGILVPVGDLGFSRLIIRDVARAERPEALARELLRVRGFGVLLVTAAFLVVGAAGGLPASGPTVAWASMFLLAEGLSYGYESAAAGSERPERFAAAQAVGGGAVVVAAVIVISAEEVTSAKAMAGLALSSAVKLAVHALTWAHGQDSPRALTDLPVRRWVRQAAPFLALAVLGAVYYRVGVVALHAIRGPADTAPYAAAMRIFDGIAVLGGVGFAAVSPVISRIHRDQPERLWSTWKRIVGLAACAVIPGGAILATAAHPLARLLFGGRYEVVGGEALALLAPGMALAILQNLSAAVVLMGDDHSSVLALTAFNVSALIGLVLLGSALSGASGAALGTSCAELLSFSSFAVLVRRRHHDAIRAAPPPAPPAPSA